MPDIFYDRTHTHFIRANLAARSSKNPKAADKSCRRRAQKGQNVFVCGANKTKKGTSFVAPWSMAMIAK
jgi:hypothetical protein